MLKNKIKKIDMKNIWVFKMLLMLVRIILAAVLYTTGTVTYFSLLLIGGITMAVYEVADKLSEHRLSESIRDKGLELLGFKVMHF